MKKLSKRISVSIFIIILIFIIGLYSININHEKTEATYKNDSLVQELELLPINHVINNKDSNLETAERFDSYINYFIKKWELKGASFALMKDDKLIYSKGYGYADVENQIPVDVKHIFRIASISKLITAVAIAKLYEDDKLNFSDKVFGENGILNDHDYLKIKDKRIKDITIEQLLRHSAGFTNYAGDIMFCPISIAEKMNVNPPADLKTMIQFALSRNLGFTPGRSTSYSNIGYGILSKVVEKVAKEDYETYIKNEILAPAGCYDMHLGRNLSADKHFNEVCYYEVSNTDSIAACDGSNNMVLRSNGGNNIEEMYGAGGWVASASELLRFLACIDNDPKVKDILKPETIDILTYDKKNALPLGWIKINNNEWIRTGTFAGTAAIIKKQRDGYSWAFISNTSTWKGPKFHPYIEQAVRIALNRVKQWPSKDMFKMQNQTNEELLVLKHIK